MRGREGLYCRFMAPMKLNSGLGGALKNDSIFKNRAQRDEGKGLGQLKQLISIYMHAAVCVCLSLRTCVYVRNRFLILLFGFRLRAAEFSSEFESENLFSDANCEIKRRVRLSRRTSTSPKRRKKKK